VAEGTGRGYLLESVGFGYVTRGSSPHIPKFVHNPNAAFLMDTYQKAMNLLRTYQRACPKEHIKKALRVVTYEYAMDIPQYKGG